LPEQHWLLLEHVVLPASGDAFWMHGPLRLAHTFGEKRPQDCPGGQFAVAPPSEAITPHAQ
jgi:hypothetical protein